MADSTRSRILLSLLHQPGYPAQLARDLGLTRTNVSNHLACLRGCGIVVAEVEGRQTRYEIADIHIVHALEALIDVVLAVDDGVPCLDADNGVAACCGNQSPQEENTDRHNPASEHADTEDTSVRRTARVSTDAHA